jgi:hypothetical protein
VFFYKSEEEGIPEPLGIFSTLVLYNQGYPLLYFHRRGGEEDAT